MNSSGIVDASSETALRRAGRGLGRRRLAAIASAAVLALLLAVIPTGPASGAEGGAEITSVEFDLGEEGDGALQPIGPSQPISYRTVSVDRAGIQYLLAPADPPALRSVRSPNIDSLAAVSFGSVIESSPDGPGLLADTLSSAFIHESTWHRGEGSAPVEILFTEPLGGNEFFLVQEAGGDAGLRIAAVLSDGSTAADPLVIGPDYEWDTGFPTSTDDSGSHWVAVVPVDALPGVSDTIIGLSVTFPAGADVKVVPLDLISSTAPEAEAPAEDREPAESAEAAPENGAPADDQTPTPTTVPTAEPETTPSTVDQTGDSQDDQVSFAAVSLDASFRPGISNDGASCVDPGAAESAPVALPGERATYCFAVTNLGTTALDQVRISDPALGFTDTVLPVASGQALIEPGQTSVFYHHNNVGNRTPDAVSTVTAAAVAGDGAAIEGLTSPQAESAGLSLAAAPTPDPQPTPDPPPTPEPQPTPVEADPTATAAQATDQTDGGSGDLQGRSEPQLAFTGPGTEPWVLAVTALGMIFFGYTVTAAFRRTPVWARLTGHAQLDAMGFE